MKEEFNVFHQFRRDHAFHYTIDYDEGSNLFDVRVYGSGGGEDWRTKKCGSILVAFERIVQDIERDLKAWGCKNG